MACKRKADMSEVDAEEIPTEDELRRIFKRSKYSTLRVEDMKGNEEVPLEEKPNEEDVEERPPEDCEESKEKNLTKEEN